MSTKVRARIADNHRKRGDLFPFAQRSARLRTLAQRCATSAAIAQPITRNPRCLLGDRAGTKRS